MREALAGDEETGETDEQVKNSSEKRLTTRMICAILPQPMKERETGFDPEMIDLPVRGG